MRTIKCDLCGRPIDPTQECRYEINEVEFHVPYAKGFEIHLEFDSETEETHGERREGWAFYGGLDFCERCWEKDPRIETIRQLLKGRE